MQPTASIVIATHNMGHLIMETIDSCIQQDYPKLEIVVYDDCSTDGTEKLFEEGTIKYYRGDVNKGVGDAFNEGIKRSTGEIVITMCADDLFTDRRVVSDMVKCFNDQWIGYVTRYYYQFVHGYPGAVRAWRGTCPIVLANNPSGLAFRREAIEGLAFSNKMFIESSQMASDVLVDGWQYHIIPWDTVAVRVHASTSTQGGYWLKRRVSSPVRDWTGIGGHDIKSDFVSLIQIKNGFTTEAVIEEIGNFIELRPYNLLNPRFWFWSIVALVTPRFILRKLPAFYRHRIGRYLTKIIKRPE